MGNVFAEGLATAWDGIERANFSDAEVRMSKGHAALKFLRKVHLYLGIFTTPALLFFAITGALQTFSLHETTQGSNYKPPAWIASLAQLHKKQTTAVPPRRARPAGPENARERQRRRCRFARRAARHAQNSAIRVAGPAQAQPGSPRQPKAGEAVGSISSAEESFADEDFLSSGLPEPGDLYADWHLFVL